MTSPKKIAIFGAGLTGCCAALEMVRLGYSVTVFEKQPLPMQGASLHNEGKLHLGYVYGADPHAETHQIMIKGSLSFIGLIESLTGVNRSVFTRSKPFTYVIPNDSQLIVQQQLDHFSQVDNCIATLYDKSDLHQESHCPGPAVQKELENCTGIFNKQSIQGVIQTDEYSVNASQISNIVSAAVMANPMITLHTNARIEKAYLDQNDAFSIELENTDLDKREQYDGVINCLWEDRVRIDRTNQIEPPREWLVRYKAAILGRFDSIDDRALMPSATLITGAYGDVVNHNDGNFYLSWYPECKLGESKEDNYPLIEKNVSMLNKKRLIQNSIKEMSRYIPVLAPILNKTRNVRVGGGYIFAWGKSDITDPNSQLHQRHLIGPSVYDRWVSVDTGKYCTAPMFGINAANELAKQLSQ